MMNSKFLTRGRCRHSYLRKTLSKVSLVKDFDQTYVSELGQYLRKTFPTLRDDCKLYIKHEVTIQNRRPDFVIHIPNVALILLEYKTSNVTTKIRREYLTQVLDTFHKFRQSLCASENSNHIRLLSILLIRNSSTRQNKIVCVKNESIPNSCYMLWYSWK
jgi:hypothetical protein